MSAITPNDLGLGNHTTSLSAAPGRVVDLLFQISGALAVVFILIGAIQYIVSAGDSKKTAQAKNTILYAVIGLVIAACAGVITHFVIKNL